MKPFHWDLAFYGAIGSLTFAEANLPPHSASWFIVGTLLAGLLMVKAKRSSGSPNE